MALKGSTSSNMLIINQYLGFFFLTLYIYFKTFTLNN
jgi:hypothetical protein